MVHVTTHLDFKRLDFVFFQLNHVLVKGFIHELKRYILDVRIDILKNTFVNVFIKN